MNKATRKNVNHLRKYIGHKIIRIREAKLRRGNDFSYTTDPIILMGFTPKGEMVYKTTAFPDEIFVFPIEFTDRNWILFSRIKKTKKTKLSKWEGREAWRIKPTCGGGFSYQENGYLLGKAPTILWATKYHICIQSNNFAFEKKHGYIADYRYANPSHWELAK